MKKLTLTENDLLARGNDCYVFQHPHNHQLLIKVVIPTIPKYKSKLREVYRDVKECKPRDETDSLFIQKIEGLVETDKGIGQVIVKEHDEQGNIARTLYDLAKHNELDAEKFSKLNAFLAWFIHTDVIINSLHCKNIVYAWMMLVRSTASKLLTALGIRRSFN